MNEEKRDLKLPFAGRRKWDQLKGYTAGGSVGIMFYIAMHIGGLDAKIDVVKDIVMQQQECCQQCKVGSTK